jgi:hypothetical protein
MSFGEAPCEVLLDAVLARGAQLCATLSCFTATLAAELKGNDDMAKKRAAALLSLSSHLGSSFLRRSRQRSLVGRLRKERNSSVIATRIATRHYCRCCGVYLLRNVSEGFVASSLCGDELSRHRTCLECHRSCCAGRHSDCILRPPTTDGTAPRLRRRNRRKRANRKKEKTNLASKAGAATVKALTSQRVIPAIGRRSARASVQPLKQPAKASPNSVKAPQVTAACDATKPPGRPGESIRPTAPGPLTAITKKPPGARQGPPRVPTKASPGAPQPSAANFLDSLGIGL